MATELTHRGKNEFEELIRALEWSNEFAIYFAVVNPPLIRKQMAEELTISLERKQIKVHSLELNSSYFDLLSIIPEKVPSYCFRGVKTEVRSALFIFGAEEAIASDADTRRLFFDSLNWQRDKLSETIACPLVIWLPEFALRILALESPDFWAWRSGVYYLEPEPVWILKDTEELFKGGTSEYDVLTYQEKIRRLQQFKALLDDYEKHSFEKKSESDLLKIRFNLLKEAGTVSFSLAEYEDAKQYFFQGLKMAEELNDKEFLELIFKNLILISAYRGDYASAEKYTENVSEIAQEIGDKESMGRSFGIFGVLTKAQGNYNKAEVFFKKALEVGKELENKVLISLALMMLGSLAKTQKKYTEAKSFLKQSLEINEEIGEKGGMVDNLLELSRLAQSQGNIDEALREIEKAQALSEDMEDNCKIARVLENQGSLAVAQGDYQHARKYYEESLAIYKQLGDKINTALVYMYLGVIAEKLGDYEEAKRRYKESLKIFKETGAKHLIALCQMSLGSLYLQTEDYNEAERSFLDARDALEIGENILHSETIKTVRQGLEQARRKGKVGKNKL